MARISESDEARIEEILDFWFGEFRDDGTVQEAIEKRWFTKDEAFDRAIGARFGADVDRAAKGDLDGWVESPRGALALTILADQFPRNLFRGSPRSFATDDYALSVTRRALAAGHDRALRPIEQSFLLMPLMHAEDRDVQEESVARFRALAESADGAVRKKLENNHDYAVRHRDIVARFGRYPHRNQVLGRASTAEEEEFLKQPGSSF